MAASRETSIVKENEDYEFDNYVQYFNAIYSGASSSLKAFFDAIAHPWDEIVYPICAILQDALIITSGKKMLDANDIFGMGPDAAILQYIIAEKEEFLSSATERMQDRCEVIKKMGTIIKEGSGPERTELVSNIVVSALLPGWLIKGIKISKASLTNYHQFRTFKNPKLFQDLVGDNKIPQKPLPIMSVSEIRNISKETALMYVITEEKNLIITPREYPRSLLLEGFGIAKIYHPEIAELRAVYAAGELSVKEGKISNINNFSGHYLPEGDHLAKLAEHIFVKQGFIEATGKFRYAFPPSGIPTSFFPEAKGYTAKTEGMSLGIASYAEDKSKGEKHPTQSLLFTEEIIVEEEHPLPDWNAEKLTEGERSDFKMDNWIEPPTRSFFENRAAKEFAIHSKQVMDSIGQMTDTIRLSHNRNTQRSVYLTHSVFKTPSSHHPKMLSGKSIKSESKSSLTYSVPKDSSSGKNPSSSGKGCWLPVIYGGRDPHPGYLEYRNRTSGQSVLIKLKP